MDFGRDDRLTGGGVLAKRRRPITLLVIVAAILAALVLLESSNTTTITGEPARRHRSRLLVESNPFQGLPSGISAEAPSSAAPVAGVSSEQAALDLARRTADENVNTAQQAVAGSHLFPEFVSAIVCPILLQARAQVITTINFLIQQFPAIAAQLIAIRDAAVAIIDILIAQHHCIVSP